MIITSSVWDRVPIDVIRSEIFPKLDAVSLGKCQRVCTSFNQLAKTPELWRKLYAAEHKGHFPKQTPPMGWRTFYIEQDTIARRLALGKFPEPVPFACDPREGFTCGNTFFVQAAYIPNEFPAQEPSDEDPLLCYDLTTAKRLDIFYEIPAEAFVEDVSGSQKVRPCLPLCPIDSTHFLCKGSSQLSIWCAPEKRCVFAADNVQQGIVHAEGSQVIYCTTKNCLEVWDWKTKQRLCQIEDPALGYSYIGQSLLLGDLFVTLMANGIIHAYDIKNGKKLYTFDSGNDYGFNRMLATDRHLVAINEAFENINIHHLAERNQAYIYEATTGKLLRTLPLHQMHRAIEGYHNTQIWHNQLIGVPRNEEGTIACWNLDTGEIVKRFTPRSEGPFADSGAVQSFQVGNPDRLVIDAYVGVFIITVWDLKKEELLTKISYSREGSGGKPESEIKIKDSIMYYGSWKTDKFYFWDLATVMPLGSLPYVFYYQKRGVWHFDGTRFFAADNIYDLTKMPSKSLLAKITGLSKLLSKLKLPCVGLSS